MNMEQLVKLGKRVRWWGQLGSQYRGHYKGIEIVTSYIGPSYYSLTAHLDGVIVGNHFHVDLVEEFYNYVNSKYKQHTEMYERLHKKHEDATIRKARSMLK